MQAKHVVGLHTILISPHNNVYLKPNKDTWPYFKSYQIDGLVYWVYNVNIGSTKLLNQQDNQPNTCFRFECLFFRLLYV